ncbi:hypothetical protein TthSNM66_23200 (plasmid) [Thermus thermophilus]|uniref:hypothetical protein n=1 Tax=Thermus thermophilus TaxID=274 RepID=UPI001FCBD6DD|nr:hypothetical protein [Thermus thermophilus]BDG27684.1 hypothetical protein TthSNM66_23200 [Thermus thermophilus]
MVFVPMLEVLVSRGKPLTREEREALKEEAEAIFQEVLGTPKGRLRVFVLEEEARGEENEA